MRTVLRITGYLVTLVGVVGLFNPAGILGIHAGVLHNLVHIGAGVLAIYFARNGSFEGTRNFSVALGLIYAIMGAMGLALGAPGSPAATGVTETDPRLFRMIPGVLEFGRADHVAHLLTGIACLAAGITAGRGRGGRLVPPTSSREPVAR